MNDAVNFAVDIKISNQFDGCNAGIAMNAKNAWNYLQAFIKITTAKFFEKLTKMFDLFVYKIINDNFSLRNENPIKEILWKQSYRLNSTWRDERISSK